jgi:arabinofuranosyltransferase
VAHRRALVVAGFGAVLVGFLVHVLVFNFVTDDAYISFRYAENLARHGALEFNLGERVEGFTNFLWTVVLAGGVRLGAPPEILSRVLGALLGAAALELTWLLARRSEESALALVPPALLAALPGFCAWSSGGLETSLFASLGLLGLLLVLRERPVAAGVVFALASMTRPEGAILLAATALAELLRTRRPDARLWIAFGVPFCAFYAWRFAYYGHPFPNTFYVKAGATAFARGWRYLGSFALGSGLWLAAPVLLFYRARDRRLALHQAVLLPVYAFYVASVGGDFMALHRFLVPVAPHLALMIHDGLRGRAWLRFAAPALLGLAVWNAVRVDRATLRFVGARDGIDSIGYLKKFADDRVLVGRWMRENLPSDTFVAVGGAGALPYASGLRALDSFGLCDAYIAHHVRPAGDRPGHTKVAPLGYLLQRRPDLVCFPPYPGLRDHGYQRACMRPAGLDEPYCCLKRADRKLGPL